MNSSKNDSFFYINLTQHSCTVNALMWLSHAHFSIAKEKKKTIVKTKGKSLNQLQLHCDKTHHIGMEKNVRKLCMTILA